MTSEGRTAGWMTPGRRWAAVAVVTALLVGLPVALRSLPAAQSRVGAAALVSQVRASTDQGWSGFVVSRGTLALPSVQNFDDVASLFGGTTQLRAWWQDRGHWRVDRLTTTGENDLVHTGTETTAYDFENAEAKVSVDPSIRLPRTGDLLPPELARRALEGVSADRVSRLPARRVAGESAPGLRVVPAAASSSGGSSGGSSVRSSVDHVDLWVDPDTGVPLRVEVYAAPTGPASFVTAFRDFTAERPADARVTYAATPGTAVRFDSVLDIADAANQYAPLRAPAEIAGLRATSATDGAVGIYGSGLTQLIAIPLRDREADALRQQLLVTPAVTQDDDHTYVQEGILGVMITGATGNGGLLLAGTVTDDTLLRAATDAEQGYQYTGSRG